MLIDKMAVIVANFTHIRERIATVCGKRQIVRSIPKPMPLAIDTSKHAKIPPGRGSQVAVLCDSVGRNFIREQGHAQFRERIVQVIWIWGAFTVRPVSDGSGIQGRTHIATSPTVVPLDNFGPPAQFQNSAISHRTVCDRGIGP